ncbi:PilI type IV pilus biogenesis protein [Salmonella enterica]|nr:PilI type IV pilus biogenesis protein [Salmonella enterica]EHI9910512.1 PilI type IV pilus biogenesis protein [Salmonella enterica]EHJ0911217.1 PilI type IV pilus biogenesis protein [Salmonella enterica]
MNNILTVSNSGVESLIDFNLDDDLNTLVKSYRTPQNKMVCILQDGRRTHRWDRSFGSVQNNHWRKFSPDGFGILGSIENIRRARDN